MNQAVITIRPAAAADWRLVRDVRLRALRDAPAAFGSTYERELGFPEHDWVGRLTGAGVTFVAFAPDGGASIGLCGGIPSGPDVVELISMWVAPEARGTAVARQLVGAVIGWSDDRGAQRVHLWVTETNEPAHRLYKRCGFVSTGERQPLPSDPTLSEIRMVCSVANA